VKPPHVTGQVPNRMETGTAEAPDSAAAEPDPPTVTNPLAAKAFRKLSTIYLYASGSFAGFSLWYPPTTPPTWGVHVAYPVVRLLNKAGLVPGELPSSIPGFTKVVRRGNAAIFFNGYTFLYYPILDFGAAGMSAYCLLLGFLIGTVYERTRRARTSSLHLILMGQIAIALALSVFVNKFNNTASWYLVVMTTAPFWVTAVAAAWRGQISPSADRSAVLEH
jgi:oligosaccharide repeat unit polymerase